MQESANGIVLTGIELPSLQRIEPAKLLNLLPSLVKAKKAFKPIKRSATATVYTKGGSQYSYDYATLTDIKESIDPALFANGLNMIYIIHSCDVRPKLRAMLIHESGEMIESEYPLILRADLQDPKLPASIPTYSVDTHQTFGAAITYAMKYLTIALLGLSSVDDDNATVLEYAQGRQEIPKAKSKPKVQDKPANGNGDPRSVCMAIASQMGISAIRFDEIAKTMYAETADWNIAEMTPDQWKAFTAHWKGIEKPSSGASWAERIKLYPAELQSSILKLLGIQDISQVETEWKLTWNMVSILRQAKMKMLVTELQLERYHEKNRIKGKM